MPSINSGRNFVVKYQHCQHVIDSVGFLCPESFTQSKNLPVFFIASHRIPIPIHTISLNQMLCEPFWQAIKAKNKNKYTYYSYLYLCGFRTHFLFNTNYYYPRKLLHFSLFLLNVFGIYLKFIFLYTKNA